MNNLFYVSEIHWDTDGEKVSLPKELFVRVPVSGEEAEDWISDYLSDTYGWCHFGFAYQEATKSLIEQLYPIGTIIELEYMEDEDIPAGTKGEVIMIDDILDIHVHWETGGSLALVPEVDKFHKAKDVNKCVICRRPYIGHGNDAYPVKKYGSCCDECNSRYVIPARLEQPTDLTDFTIIVKVRKNGRLDFTLSSDSTTETYTYKTASEVGEIVAEHIECIMEG